MRSPLFRGCDLIRKVWVYGDLSIDVFENPVILPCEEWQEEVRIEIGSVGQNTFFKDKYGHSIYVGDIVEISFMDCKKKKSS